MAFHEPPTPLTLGKQDVHFRAAQALWESAYFFP
jgi:hypothetical protein